MKKLIFKAAGSKHTQFSDIKAEMMAGVLLDLQFEPDNEFDSNAVAIYFCGHFVGYVPTELTLEDPIVNQKRFAVNKVNDFGFEVTEV